MRAYETITRTREITESGACISVVCDICHREAERPDMRLPFEWGSVGFGFGAISDEVAIDGEVTIRQLDLCPKCVSKVILAVQGGTISKAWK